MGNLLCCIDLPSGRLDPVLNRESEFDTFVTEVYDGDTIHINVNLNGQFGDIKLRLLGFDAPEMKVGAGVPNRDLIKYAAQCAREALSRKILGRRVRVKTRKTKAADPYGRILGEIFCNGENINEYMIKLGCLPYRPDEDGFAKAEYTQEQLEKIIRDANVRF